MIDVLIGFAVLAAGVFVTKKVAPAWFKASIYVAAGLAVLIVLAKIGVL